MVPSEAWRRYRMAMKGAQDAADAELRRSWERLGGEEAAKADPGAMRDAMLVLVPAIVERYGGLAAKAAAEYYRDERERALGSAREAVLAQPVGADVVRDAVRYAAGHLFDGNGGEEAGA